MECKYCEEKELIIDALEKEKEEIKNKLYYDDTLTEYGKFCFRENFVKLKDLINKLGVE